MSHLEKYIRSLKECQKHNNCSKTSEILEGLEWARQRDAGIKNKPENDKRRNYE